MPGAALCVRGWQGQMWRKSGPEQKTGGQRISLLCHQGWCWLVEPPHGCWFRCWKLRSLENRAGCGGRQYL